jgi:hypothetical protein
MSSFNLLPNHSSCHRRRTGSKTKTRARQARPMEPGDLLQFAPWAASPTHLHLDLLLYRGFRSPSSSLHPPAKTPAMRAAGSGKSKATLNGGGGGCSGRGRESQSPLCFPSKRAVVGLTTSIPVTTRSGSNTRVQSQVYFYLLLLELIKVSYLLVLYINS